MGNLRKLIVAVLSVSLVFTSMTAVFAADSATVANADKAATLKDLGLYSGQDANDPRVGLENALTTQDSLIFLAKLFGYNDAANSLTADQVAQALAKFDDAASISDYAKNVVAYSASNSVLNGISDGERLFTGAKDTVTAARFATFMLKQMGYEVADYKESVAKLAETKGSRIDATITGDLTRDAAVGIMYGTLTAEKASGKTIIADIVGDNADLKKKAEKAGLIEKNSKSSKELSVESVKALNTKQLVIQFNSEMDRDSAQNKANYEIKDKGTVEKTLTNNSCKLGDDMRTVTITLDSTVEDCLTNSSKAKVIVSEDVMAANGRKLGTDKEANVDVQDGLLPTVKEVKATGEKNIRITFSEPVYEGKNNTRSLSVGNFAVKTGTYYYFVQNAELNLDAINLEITSKLIEGPIEITVNAAGLQGDVIQDYAGYKVFKGDHTFNYVRDVSVSVVTVKSAKPNEVILGFSKPVKGKNIKLYHSVKGTEAYESEATTTGYVDEIKFTFDEPLPIGNIKLFLVNSETSDEQLIDSYGIKVPPQTLTCEIGHDDTTAPDVESYNVYKDESITISFNEELDAKVATNPENYVVKKLSDNKKISFEVILDDSRNVVLRFLDKLEDHTEYQLLIKKCKDISGNRNVSDYEYSFKTSDNKAPTVIDDPEADQHCFAVAEKGKIFIIYSEAMNEAQMLDKANYLVSIDQGDQYRYLGDEDTITKVNDRIIQIYVKELADKNDSKIRPSVKIAPIMDLAGYRLYDRVEPYIVQSIGPENVYIEEAQLIAKNKIRVAFNKKMASVSENDIKLTNLSSPGSISIVSCESNIINSNGKTEVVLILDKELATDGTDEEGNEIGITTIEATSSESEWGSKLRPQLTTILGDKLAPEIVKWDHDNDNDGSTDDIAKVIVGGDLANPQFYDDNYTVPQNTTGNITIYFSEVIKASTLTKITFSVPGFTITDITAHDDTKTVVLTVKANADNTSVTPTITQVFGISDTADNPFAPGSTWKVTFDQQTT